MVSVRTLSWLSTVALVIGALLVGDALHGAVVTSQYPLTSPAALFRFLAGFLSIWLGVRARTPIEYVPSDDDSDDAHGGPRSDPVSREHEYDPDLSPFGEGPVDDDQRDDRDESRDGG